MHPKSLVDNTLMDNSFAITCHSYDFYSNVLVTARGQFTHHPQCARFRRTIAVYISYKLLALELKFRYHLVIPRPTGQSFEFSHVCSVILLTTLELSCLRTEKSLEDQGRKIYPQLPVRHPKLILKGRKCFEKEDHAQNSMSPVHDIQGTGYMQSKQQMLLLFSKRRDVLKH